MPLARRTVFQIPVIFALVKVRALHCAQTDVLHGEAPCACALDAACGPQARQCPPHSY